MNAKIYAGEFIMVMGPSGAGKSTLFRLLCRLEDPEEGSIHFKNIPLIQWEPTKLRKQIHYVYQTPVLFMPTVAKNLAYPLKLQGKTLLEKEMLSLLKKVGLTEEFLHRPIDQLSGGEKQRISLARSLSLQPEVLLLDEPTSSLDFQSTEIIEEVIRQYHKEGHTILWITHQQEQGEKLGTRRWMMENGIVKEGMIQ
jgi:ABC-type iron transport system FetAB ATPase subunit